MLGVNVPTLDEIDEALAFATEIPVEERGAPWHAYVDRLLAERKNLTDGRMVRA